MPTSSTGPARALASSLLLPGTWIRIGGINAVRWTGISHNFFNSGLCLGLCQVCGKPEFLPPRARARAHAHAHVCCMLCAACCVCVLCAACWLLRVVLCCVVLCCVALRCVALRCVVCGVVCVVCVCVLCCVLCIACCVLCAVSSVRCACVRPPARPPFRA